MPTPSHSANSNWGTIVRKNSDALCRDLLRLGKLAGIGSTTLSGSDTRTNLADALEAAHEESDKHPDIDQASHTIRLEDLRSQDSAHAFPVRS